MADNVSIAIIHDAAINRLTAMAASISEKLDIAPPVAPDFNNAAYQQAMRLRSLADWLMTVNNALQPLAVEGISDATETQNKPPRRNR